MGLAAVVLALATACSSATTSLGSGPTAGATPPGSGTVRDTASSSPLPQAPLTGRTTTQAASVRPVVAVALVGGAGVVGVAAGDVVYEAYPGAGQVRLTVLYQSSFPPLASTVTTTVPTDPVLLSPLRGVLASAGGSQGFLSQLAASPVVAATPQSRPHAFTLSAAGLAVSPSALVSLGKQPPPLLSWRAPGQGFAVVGARTALSVAVSLPGYPTLTFASHGGVWTSAQQPWLPAAANVIVQEVRYKTATVSSRTGLTTQIALLDGRGSCVAASGTEVVGCSWLKAGPAALTTYFDASGTPLGFAPGRTVVLLLPVGVGAGVSS